MLEAWRPWGYHDDWEVAMNPASITLPATLQADGVTLQLDERIPLPPGRVTVTVEASGRKQGPGMLEVLDRIHREQRARGQRPMTDEEMAAEIAAARAESEEDEQRWQAIWSQTSQPLHSPDKP
jgi:hypothetical protein